MDRGIFFVFFRPQTHVRTGDNRLKGTRSLPTLSLQCLPDITVKYPSTVGSA